MIYIAHRGNLAGPNSDDENKPEYLLKAINAGFYVETDLWLINSELFSFIKDDTSPPALPFFHPFVLPFDLITRS